MPRFFTLVQAELLLASVDPDIRYAIEVKAHYDQADHELHESLRRIMMMGGTLVDQDKVAGQKSRRESSAVRFKDAVEKVQSHGCVLKDLEIGLIDFPTLYRGEEVYLCWKLGEDGIAYWHGVSEGFRGRKKIDQEFLDNHKGDLTH